jgi:two-component system, chemotaxis family, sensor kinase CheA
VRPTGLPSRLPKNPSPKRFHAAFFEEALAGLDQAEADLILFEKRAASRDTIDSSFRAIHSVKGSAGSLGFEQITLVAHELEALLETYRSLSSEQAFLPSDEHVSVMLSALDLLRTQIVNAQLKQGDVSSSRVSAMTQKLKRVQAELELSPLTHTFRIVFKPSPEMIQCGNDPLRYIDALAKLGQVTSQALWDDQPFNTAASEPPLFQTIGEPRSHLSWVLSLDTERSQQEVLDLFEWVQDLCQITIALSETCDAGQSEADAATVKPELSSDSLELVSIAQAQGSRRAQRAIQVPSEKIDHLLDQLADLAAFQYEMESLLAHQAGHDLFQRLTRQTRSLQDAILAMRMSPIASLCKRFERVVRDAEIDLGKTVNVQFEGETHELDSSIIERLIDPVTHLIRNALDHGIETPAQRRQVGKPEEASIRLSAEQRANSFILHIEDDGAGIPVEAIRAKAVQKGFATPDSRFTDARWLEFIFAPGFSTATTSSQWSGRGVGLDAVLKAIEDLNGQILLQTTPGKGTKFSIELPLTLALTDALIVEVGSEQYAIALGSVFECLDAHSSAIKELPNGQLFYRLRGNLLPFAKLADLMMIDIAAPDTTRFVAIALQHGEDSCVLKVSRIVGQKQIVIKNIAKNLGKARHCQSATVLGDGKVIFVLDASSVLRDVGSLELAGASAD